ncbi:MAG TPA: hypothetical protein VHO00_10600 [Actinomycetes bacterium]|jgi:hypothetical protein|nr:hypothetical protein [Actinomycetes bacterium]
MTTTTSTTDSEPRRRGHERGDVPGWVLITIMTAGIVAVLWPFAEQYLKQILQAALDAVAP